MQKPFDDTWLRQRKRKVNNQLALLTSICVLIDRMIYAQTRANAMSMTTYVTVRSKLLIQWCPGNEFARTIHNTNLQMICDMCNIEQRDVLKHSKQFWLYRYVPSTFNRRLKISSDMGFS